MKDFFFTSKYSTKISNINTVSILEASTNILTNDVILPRVVINNAVFYYGTEGKEAIDALYDCGFYDANKHKQALSYYKILMKNAIPKELDF